MPAKPGAGQSKLAVTGQRRDDAITSAATGSTASRPRALWRLLLHPLMAICAVQAALSLSLVWSNTAYVDEAYYLWAGHLEMAHWLHGSSLPQALFEGNLSGSPVIYPPLSAVAGSIGGLAGARILSLCFMLFATVLLYCTASRLFGRTAAIAASALWSVTEPALRLSFATYDPVSVCLTALSVWLAVEAGYRRRRNALVLASSASLALADAAAYSGIVMVPVVIVLACIVWLPRMLARQAVSCAALAAGGWLVFFGLLIVISRSWPGLMSTVLNRAIHDHQETTVIVLIALRYSLFIMPLAVTGAVIAAVADEAPRALSVIVMACAAFVVPVAQVHYHSSTSIDKHLAYGLWLAAISAGYGISKLIALPTPRIRPFVAACCAIALIYPAADGWKKAWDAYHGWANATSFAQAIRHVARYSEGAIVVPAADLRIDHIAEFYAAQGVGWRRWESALPSLDPSGIHGKQLESFYAQQLRTQKYGVFALAFEPRPGRKLTGDLRLLRRGHLTGDELFRKSFRSVILRGLPYLAVALENDPSYRLVATGFYDSSDFLTGSSSDGFYAIWESARK